MSKDFAALYNDTGDSTALEQKFFIKEETTRGTFIAPTGADFLFHTGGSVNFSRPKVSSPHKTGRHHTGALKERTVTEWTLNSLFNVDTTLGSASSAEVDPAMRVLHKSLLGVEDTAAGAQYTPGTPNLTFTILENMDKMGKQSVGGFVNSATLNFPGDGMSNSEWSGNAKTAIYCGIGLTTTDNDQTGGFNDITLQAGEGARFQVGGQIMLVEADGTTRSADTPDGSPRQILSFPSADVLRVDGADLADADGSGANIYVCYYEPETPVAVNDPLVGLEGSLTIAGFTGLNCVRNATVTLDNQHELQDNCFGEDGLGGSLYIPGGRLNITLDLELNFNHTMVGFLNTIKDDLTGQDIELILGDSSGRHLDIDMDRAIFTLPPVDVPESGSVPVTITSAAIIQSAIDAKDEISVHYK